jgi:nucleoside-diphosphate-sugar epimerase
MTSTVLVLGARGRAGLAIARAFADAGWRVVGHMRPGASVPADARDDARIQWITSDLYDTNTLVGHVQALGGADVVVHALNPAYTHKAWKAQVLPMADASIRATRALSATLMVVGNIYNFGEGMPTLLREDTPQRARTIKGQIRIAMEAHLQRSGVRAIVIRAGDFFGSGKGTWFDQAIVKGIQQGVFTYPGHKDVATAWAYLPDLGRAFVAVAAKRTQLKPFEVLHFAGSSVTGAQWVEAITPIARQHAWIGSDEALRYKTMPWAVIKLLAWVNPTLAALVEMRYLWDTPHALDNRKLVALIGAEPHTPLPQALQATLNDLGLCKPPALLTSPAVAPVGASHGAPWLGVPPRGHR